MEPRRKKVVAGAPIWLDDLIGLVLLLLDLITFASRSWTEVGFLRVVVATGLLLGIIITIQSLDPDEGYPFGYFVILIVILNLVFNPVSVVGRVGNFLVVLILKFLVVGVILIVGLFDTRGPPSACQALWLSVYLFLVEFIVNGIRQGQFWGWLGISVAFLLASLGSHLVNTSRPGWGGIIVLLAWLLNRFVLTTGIDGFNVGTTIWVAQGIICVLRWRE